MSEVVILSGLDALTATIGSRKNLTATAKKVHEARAVADNTYGQSKRPTKELGEAYKMIEEAGQLVTKAILKINGVVSRAANGLAPEDQADLFQGAQGDGQSQHPESDVDVTASRKEEYADATIVEENGDDVRPIMDEGRQLPEHEGDDFLPPTNN